MGIIIFAVARHLFSNKGQAEIGLVFGGQFYFCHREAGIFAEKLVYLIDMLAGGHYPANLVDDARLAQPQEGESFVLGDFFFKFIARQSALPRRAFYGEIGLVVAQPYTHRSPTGRTDISLHNMTMRDG